MGRPKIDQEQKRIIRYVLRFTVSEQKRFNLAAHNAGLAVHQFIRNKLTTGRFPEPKIAQIDLGVYLELKKIGVNVNQLAKHANAGKLPGGIRTVLLQLIEQQELIIKLLLDDRNTKDR